MNAILLFHHKKEQSYVVHRKKNMELEIIMIGETSQSRTASIICFFLLCEIQGKNRGHEIKSGSISDLEREREEGQRMKKGNRRNEFDHSIYVCVYGIVRTKAITL
jgi:hypothetical protein